MSLEDLLPPPNTWSKTHSALTLSPHTLAQSIAA
jgi:hypothetical protein